jgi:hypothetical protein
MQDREGRFTAENLMRSQYEQDRAQAERDRSARFGAEDVMRGRFEQDRAQAERDRSARFGAEDVMRSRYDAERQARFGAQDAARSAFETEEASRLRATEALQGFAPLTQALRDQAASGLFTSGQAQRELDQRALDMAYADYVEQREYPYQQINYALGVLQGTPYDTRNISLTQGQQFIQSPSIYGQTIGGLGALGSAYFMSRNRKVISMAKVLLRQEDIDKLNPNELNIFKNTLGVDNLTPGEYSYIPKSGEYNTLLCNKL